METTMNDSDLSQTITAGSLLVIETGEYSDYSAGNPVRVVRDFTKREVVQEFVTNWNPEQYHCEDEPRPEYFLPWLTANGYVVDVDTVERWHVGQYGDFRP